MVARVIYYDQRGCGKSSKANSYDLRSHVSDLNQLIQALAPKGKFFLAGSSWESILTLLYSISYLSDIDAMILSGLVRWEGRNINSRVYASELEML